MNMDYWEHFNSILNSSVFNFHNHKGVPAITIYTISMYSKKICIKLAYAQNLGLWHALHLVSKGGKAPYDWSTYENAELLLVDE